jgi:hypothetical protein
MQQAIGIDVKNLYLKFCASLYHYYRKRDSTPQIFVFGTSTVIVGFNILFAYQFIQYYFFTPVPLNKIIVLIMVSVVGILNYFLVLRKGAYIQINPSKEFKIGVIIYIIVSLALMIFITSMHRAFFLKT